MSVARDNLDFSWKNQAVFEPTEIAIDWLSELTNPFEMPSNSRSSDDDRINIEMVANTIFNTNGFGDESSRKQIKNELTYIIDNGSVWSLAREINSRLQALGSDLTVTGEIQPHVQHTTGIPPVPYVAGHQAILTLKRGDDFVDRIQAMRLKDQNRR